MQIDVAWSTNLNDGHTKMDDFDFGLAGCPGLLCHSNSPTEARRINLLDVYGSFQFANLGGLRLDKGDLILVISVK